MTEKQPPKLKPWAYYKRLAKQQERDFNLGKSTVCESAENLRALDELIIPRWKNIQWAMKKLGMIK